MMRRRTRDATQPGRPSPFHPPVAQATTAEQEQTAQPVMSTGPRAPSGAPAPARSVLSVPTDLSSRHLERTPELTVQVCGLHGGAGASTVAALLGEQATDCGIGLAGLVDAAAPVVLVARTHGHGLDQALLVGQQWSAGQLAGVPLLGVVLVQDGPALTGVLSRLIRSVEGAFPRVWQLGWSEDLRHNPDPSTLADVPTRMRRVRKSVLTQATETRAATQAPSAGQSAPAQQRQAEPLNRVTAPAVALTSNTTER